MASGLNSEPSNALLVKGYQGWIDVVSPGGDVLAMLLTPHPDPGNLAFWGSSLYITDHGPGGVYRLDVGVAGLALY